MSTLLDWNQKITSTAGIRSKQSHMSCCGLGGVYGFRGAIVEKPVDVKEDDAEYWRYMEITYGKDYNTGESLPENDRISLTKMNVCHGMPDWVYNASTYARWKYSQRLDEYNKSPTLEEVCKREARKLNSWSHGSYQQIIMSGCVSEFVPRTDGEGAYNDGFHMGRFVAWLKHSCYGSVFEGPVSWNANHNSMVQCVMWIPPWVDDECQYENTYANLTDAELANPVGGYV
jgi:hypothetical protein